MPPSAGLGFSQVNRLLSLLMKMELLPGYMEPAMLVRSSNMPGYWKP